MKSEIDAFLAKYDEPIVKLAQAVRKKLRARLPHAIELVYDNYNALVFGFGPTERAGDALFSIALYPRWVTLFFLHGASLRDPQKVLKGSGKIVRHVVLKDASDVDRPEIVALMEQALAKSDVPMSDAKGRTVIKSISPKQRPRRPTRPPASKRPSRPSGRA